jgi:hypothetical protein
MTWVWVDERWISISIVTPSSLKRCHQGANFKFKNISNSPRFTVRLSERPRLDSTRDCSADWRGAWRSTWDSLRSAMRFGLTRTGRGRGSVTPEKSLARSIWRNTYRACAHLAHRCIRSIQRNRLHVAAPVVRLPKRSTRHPSGVRNGLGLSISNCVFDKLLHICTL